MNMRMMVTEKPNSGEIKRDIPMSVALLQFTAVSVAPRNKEYAIPTPKIEPIRVCELEQGIPKYQVSKFQKIALISDAIIILKLCARF